MFDYGSRPEEWGQISVTNLPPPIEDGSPLGLIIVFKDYVFSSTSSKYYKYILDIF